MAGDGAAPVAGSGFRSGAPPLGPGAEFNLIREFLAARTHFDRQDIRVGPGDDATVVAGDGIVISSDLSIEDVHFRREWLEPDEIGYRAAAAALSDLAAMAARPIGVLASLALASEDASSIAGEIMRGVRSAVEALGGELIGGDLTRSPRPLILDIVAVGEAVAPVLRGGAAPGDEIWVTGSLGGAAAALRAWIAGAAPEPDARARFASPTPRVREALWLAERLLPRAMLDISDGLAGDLGHLMAASGVAIVIDPEAVPVHPAANRSAESPADAIHLALTGGEDYELCFASRPGAVSGQLREFRETFDTPLSLVGRVEAGSGLYRTGDDGERLPLRIAGFQHFGGSG
jgi:thiamine-monophosphate kinase